MIAYCLADVFNLQLWPTNRPATYPDVDGGLRTFIQEVLLSVPSATEVTIRLYGGWHRETPDSRVDFRLMMGQAIRNVPKRYGTRRLRLQLADHPIWDPSILILRSLRDSPLARVNVRLEPATDCVSRDSCTFPTLRQWCAGKCPNPLCRVKLMDVTQRTRQKIVDTLLTADAMAIIQHRLADAVILASDDDDMIPALLALAASDLPLTHMRRKVPRDTAAEHAVLSTGPDTTIRQW